MKTIGSRNFDKTIIFVIVLLVLSLSFVYPLKSPFACGGKDIVLSDNPLLPGLKSGNSVVDDQGNVLAHTSESAISPGLALAIAERYVKMKSPDTPVPLIFRKLELVHGKLIYQFESPPLQNYKWQYHLGPVNFAVRKLVLDVDAKTGDLYLASGCGSAPGKLLSAYSESDFSDIDMITPVFSSNNTNFIARNTGNEITIDGRISPDEWKDTGHRYFYLLGTYRPHQPAAPHEDAYYYAEVWTQVDGQNIYFAVKTDSPNWIALMFKSDPNLGMLWSYKDAKLMKSDGEVSDRHFTQRLDKTYQFALDQKEDVVAKGHYQNDYYTYEFAFPLQTGDDQDISFEFGRAYNLLLVAGNTLDHYGIFTMDKAHADHDHSKNNREHVDVWASNETTFRIGTQADRDIFGNPVVSTFTNFVSGFDPGKTGNHFHYAAAHLKDLSNRSFLARHVIWFFLLAGVLGVGFILLRIRSSSGTDPGGSSAGFDLMKIQPIRKFITWRYFRHVFIIPTLLIFIAIIYHGLFDTQDGQRNIATVYTWTLWWSLIIFTLILTGRFWCMMCPFAAIGDFAQKFVSLNKKLPRWLQNMNMQTIGFLLLTWAFTIMAFGSSPLTTAVVILIILTAAVVFSMVYQRRSFCRHMCPIGAVIGIYSMVSPIELRSCNKGRCDVHQKKTCVEACPMLESPEDMDNNIYCNFCMKCQSACPSQNLGLRLRSFGKDIYASFRKSRTEAFAALFLLGVVIVETLAMTSWWKPMEDSVSTLTGITSPAISYSIVFTLVLLLPVGGFYLVCYLLTLWLGRSEYKTRDIATPFAFLFIPLGVGLHFAHNIQHLLIESPIALPATIRFLKNMGIGISLPVNWNPAPLLGLQPIFIIQMIILLGGFGFTLYVLYRLLKRYQKPLNHIYKMTLAMSLYAIVVVISASYMLGLPMSGRHVH